ncbi:OAM dimerization domain-containing protein [Mycoplasma sp. P36-A1]|uniref:lysine 5,6-aminomutase subunit beta n=1 Tax=Mycoplasma sp. P36-A1 TaxID=3252900 RepID=UPI003C2BBDE8
MSSTLDMKNVLPYGDTMNDGKVQLSFTLPVNNDQKGIEAAKITAKNMGLENPLVPYAHKLDDGFTFYVVYGQLTKGLDYDDIKVVEVETEVMDMHETDDYIKENIGRKIIVVGASTGTDAHTVGIDAIMNMKGFAGHYGLERYDMIDAYNLGSQVENEVLIQKAIDLNADILLVSQTVTQKDVHIENMTNLVELLEASNLRDKVILIGGGPRISHELAKELGYDAGFGPGKFADDVASFAVQEMVERNIK